MLELYQTKWLEKGSLIRGSIELPSGTTKEQALEIIQTIKSYRTSTGDRDVLVLSGGAKLNNQTVSPVDAQLSEQDAAINKKVCQITGVPPQFIFENTESKYNAAQVEGEGQDVVRFCFRPRLENLEPELTTKLLSEDEQIAGISIRLDTSALQRGDTAQEMTTAAAGANQGLLTPNEARQQIGEQPIASPENDELRTPTHLVQPTPDAAPDGPAPEQHSKTSELDHYAAFQPLITAAIERVETKTTKALDTAAKKPEGDRIPYTNALAESQATYCSDSLLPIAQTIAKVTGKTIDVPAIANAYAGEIRKRAAGKPAKELILIVGEHTNAG
jgi:hypothetical protein